MTDSFDPIQPRFGRPGFLRALRGATLQATGIGEPEFAFSRWSLTFVDPAVEAAYVAYRNPKILAYLRPLLWLGAVLVEAGALIDIGLSDPAGFWAMLGLRAGGGLGLVAAAALTYLRPVRRNLQGFILCGTVLLPLVWLATVQAAGAQVAQYVGVLPINLMLTFLVSGLMFAHARWIGLGAAAVYVSSLATHLDDPGAAIFYLLVMGLYAGFAGYVAERARREAWVEAGALDRERVESERLLLSVLPRSIAGRMRGGAKLIADRHEEATVLFADVVGFTPMSARLGPEELVGMLDRIFTRFDAIADALDLEKIKTIGDCYMMAGGLPGDRRRDPGLVAEAALRMQAALAEVAAETGNAVTMRVGMHCGPVVAGVIGRSKFIYDLWGDTVNLASRMESHARPGTIQVTEALAARLRDGFTLTPRGVIEVKGKGPLPTWELTGRAP